MSAQVDDRAMGAMDEDEIIAKLEKALIGIGGTHDLRRDVFPMLVDGRAQWWARGHGCVITEIITYPNCKVVNYWLVAGDMADCLALQSEIEMWARKQGCDAAVAMGRAGWSKVLPHHGWGVLGTAYVRVFEQEEAAP